MTTPFRTLCLSASLTLAALGASTMTASADFVGISRCNVAGGSSQPALHIVSGGDRMLVQVGEYGLTRNMIFNRSRAMAWARNSGLFEDGTTFGNYTNHLCGFQVEEAEAENAGPAEPEGPGDGCDFCDALD